MKRTKPILEVAHSIPRAALYPVPPVRFTAVVDLAGGLGIPLPALMRAKRGLTVLAAIRCSVLLMPAIWFHVSRGDILALPLNLGLPLPSLFAE